MRLPAAELKAMKRPSELMEGEWLSSSPAVPSAAEEMTVERGWQEEEAPEQVS